MLTARKLTQALIFIAPLALIACKDKAAPAGAEPGAAPAAAGAKVEITEANRTEAKEIFSMRCSPCHGATGMGDGAASAGLTPKPANFHNPEWQKGVTDEHIEKIIVLGGGAVGKSPMMPGNPDLADKPGTVAALREIIRGFKG
jgi:cytochrome c5